MEKSRREELKKKGLEGSLTLEDMKEIVGELRQERVSAGYASRKSKQKKGEMKEEKKEEMRRDLFADLKEDAEGERDEEES